MNCQNCNADMECLAPAIHWCSRCGSVRRNNDFCEPSLVAAAWKLCETISHGDDELKIGNAEVDVRVCVPQ